MYYLWAFVVLYLIGNFGCSYQQTTFLDPYYIAGVVEFRVPQFKYKNETSAQEYIEIIKSDEAKSTDIIVFPEQTLNQVFTPSYLPNATDEIAPCDDKDGIYEQFLIDISCASRSSGKYIVINILEKSDCTEESQEAIGDNRPCARDGLNKYNTNVVFDRNGRVISTYRKWNLWGEANKNTTYKPEYGVFDTDFGVRFGHFICFDILFYTPIQELVDDGITDFIFPTMWFAELPFLTALQIQAGWSYANNVNLLAAAANRPISGSSGTGIYAGKSGPLVEVVHTQAVTKLYVSQVPKKGYVADITDNYIQGVSNRNDFFFKRDAIDNYKTLEIDTSLEEQNTTICQNDLCCSFKIILERRNVSSDSQSYNYRMAVYNGERTYTGFGEGYFQICAILACTSSNMSSCGTVFSSDIREANDFVFKQILIEGKFKDERKMLIMPNSLDTSLLSLNPKDFQFEIKEHYVRYELSRAADNLITFGIYANVFDVADPGGQHKIVACPLLLVSFGVILMIFN